MKTLCLLESISRADGGIFEAELALQRAFHQEEGVQVSVVGLRDNYTEIDAPRWLPLTPQVATVFGPSGIGYAPGLSSLFPHDVDLAYAAVLWKYPSKALLDWQKKFNKPVILAPHGSLDAWALNNSKLKKKLAAFLYKNDQLRSASCFRALCQSEADSIRAYGLNQRIEVVPNGVVLPDERTLPHSHARKRLLFLGRIHPKKGLVDALSAWAELKSHVANVTFDAWQFVIAGWDQAGHEAELLSLCGQMGLKVFKRSLSHASTCNSDNVTTFTATLDEADVVFWGPSFDKEKEELLRSADAFILPSFSEGLPMSVLEAWAYGLPVIMTPECNLPEGFAAHAAIEIRNEDKRVGSFQASPFSFINGLQTLFDMSETDRINMGRRGRLLVQEKFTWRKVASQMHMLFREFV